MVQGSKNTSEADDEDLVSIVEVLHVPEASSTVDHEEWESFRARRRLIRAANTCGATVPAAVRQLTVACSCLTTFPRTLSGKSVSLPAGRLGSRQKIHWLRGGGGW